ncbi:MAG: DUF2256 and DUF3253 domain-containing protein [Planctomycetota bacterium]
MAMPLPKPCAHCGREIQWRKKWERDWDQVRYCSDRCRKEAKRDRGQGELLEQAILDLLAQRDAGKSICPSEAAKQVDSENWRELMEPSRQAARRLVVNGRVEVTQSGQVVDPSRARGPIRIRLAR